MPTWHFARVDTQTNNTDKTRPLSVLSVVTTVPGEYGDTVGTEVTSKSP